MESEDDKQSSAEQTSEQDGGVRPSDTSGLLYAELVYAELAKGLTLEEDDEVPSGTAGQNRSEEASSQTFEHSQNVALIHEKRAGMRKRNLLFYDGALGEILKIYFITLFLSIMTLGIYSFWGRTRLRAYMIGCVSLSQDRFEYLGHGSELLWGFVKAVPVLLFLSALALPAFLFDPQSLFWEYVFYAGASISLFLLLQMATFGSLRYRVSRLSWRGIRSYMLGSVWAYTFLAAKRFFANVFSLGLLMPFSDLMKHEYVVRYSFLGNIPLEFDRKLVNKQMLFAAHNKIYRVIFLFILFNVLGFALSFSGYYAYSGWVVFFSAILFSPFMNIARIWYRAALMRAKMQGLKAGPIRFEFDVGNWEMAKFTFGNLFIFIFTLGLGYPLILHRKMAFLAAHTVVVGPLDSIAIQQATENASSGFGEGLATALDVDIGIFG